MRGGRILFLGNDGKEKKIYSLWLKGESGWSNRLIRSFLNIYQLPENELHLVDIPLKGNLLLTAGYYFCRLSALKAPGLYLLKFGLRKLYAPLREIVRAVKAGLPNLP